MPTVAALGTMAPAQRLFPPVAPDHGQSIPASACCGLTGTRRAN